jgi:hypothetical protein
MGPAPSASAHESRFREVFGRWARRVRRRLALGVILTGAAGGLVLATAASAAAWKTRHGPIRPWTAAGGVAGAIAGAAIARRKRLGDTEVALFLDGKLGAHEAITTAVEMGKPAPSSKDTAGAKGGAASKSPSKQADSRRADRDRDSDPEESPGYAVVLAQATEALEKATSKQVRTRVLRPWHAAVPLAAGAIAYLSWIPLPPAPAGPTPPPGSEIVKIADVAGLEKVIALAEVNARDEAQRERLKKLAEDARKLQQKLKDGVEKREAQADLAKLKDGIVAERLSLGDGQERQGLESALGKMAQNPDLKDAAKALGDRDLTDFDEQMQKLANKLEKQDRERARKTLEEAAEAARKGGAPNVAKSLEAQKDRLGKKGGEGDALKELAKELGDSLPDDAKDALKDMQNSGSSKAQQKLAEKLDEALKKMSPAERKKLAENLKKRAGKMSPGDTGEGPSKEDLEDLSKKLDTDEGMKELEKQLEDMAKEDPSADADREKDLDDAEKGLEDTEGQIVPLPAELQGLGNKGGKGQKGDKGNKGGKGDGSGADLAKDAQPGHSDGGGPGNHNGQTGVVDGPGVKARADAKINRGRPMPGVTLGRTQGRPGETANVKGTGALGDAAASEIGGVDRSVVPEEYREQLGRYFQPK